MKTMTWTQRICIASGLALASVFSVPAIAGADGCYMGCATPSTVLANNVQPPTVGDGSGGGQAHTAASVADGSSSLPFTGADIGELAVVGAGAIVVGGVLVRRRRSAA